MFYRFALYCCYPLAAGRIVKSPKSYKATAIRFIQHRK